MLQHIRFLEDQLVLIQEQLKCCLARRAGYGVSAKGGDVAQHRIVGEHLHHLATGDKRTHGQATPKRFSDGENIWRDAELLEGKESTGAPHAALDLVENKKRAGLVTTLAQFQHELPVGNSYTRVALDGFHDNTCGSRCYFFKVFDVIKFNKFSF